MSELRCKPGDLAVVIQAQFTTNLGRIVRIIGIDDRKGDLRYPVAIPTWVVRCDLPMTWYDNNKRYRRKQGPVPDAYLQPIRGNSIGKDIADALPGLVIPSKRTRLLMTPAQNEATRKLRGVSNCIRKALASGSLAGRDTS